MQRQDQQLRTASSTAAKQAACLSHAAASWCLCSVCCARPSAGNALRPCSVKLTSHTMCSSTAPSLLPDLCGVCSPGPEAPCIVSGYCAAGCAHRPESERPIRRQHDRDHLRVRHGPARALQSPAQAVQGAGLLSARSLSSRSGLCTNAAVSALVARCCPARKGGCTGSHHMRPPDWLLEACWLLQARSWLQGCLTQGCPTAGPLIWQWQLHSAQAASKAARAGPGHAADALPGGGGRQGGCC